MRQTEQLLLTVHKQGPLSQEEVARLLGISQSAVSTGEERALRKLRKAIEQSPALRECLLRYLENEAEPRQDFYKFIRENV